METVDHALAGMHHQSGKSHVLIAQGLHIFGNAQFHVSSRETFGGVSQPFNRCGDQRVVVHGNRFFPFEPFLFLALALVFFPLGFPLRFSLLVRFALFFFGLLGLSFFFLSRL